MGQSPAPSPSDNLTIMWRMKRAGGLRAHAMIGLEGRGAWLTWCVNDRPLGTRAFDDWTGAIQGSERLKRQYWAVGWRPASDDDA